MAILDITTNPGPYPSGWGLLDDDAQTINDADTSTLPQARITAFKMYETAGAGGAGGGDVATDSIWDAKGDLAGGTGADTAARLAIGTDGYHLVADSGEATGLNWAADPGTEIAAFDFGSSSSTSEDVDVTGWGAVELRWDGIGFNVADGLWVRVSTDGISFDAGASDYRRNTMDDGSNSTGAGTEMQINANAIGTAGRHGWAHLMDLSSGSHKTKYNSISGSQTTGETVVRHGFRDAAQVDTHIRIFAALGNTINAGKLRVIGVS